MRYHHDYSIIQVHEGFHCPHHRVPDPRLKVLIILALQRVGLHARLIVDRFINEVEVVQALKLLDPNVEIVQLLELGIRRLHELDNQVLCVDRVIQGLDVP